jgi:hypothetical protein
LIAHRSLQRSQRFSELEHRSFGGSDAFGFTENHNRRETVNVLNHSGAEVQLVKTASKALRSSCRPR